MDGGTVDLPHRVSLLYALLMHDDLLLVTDYRNRRPHVRLAFRWPVGYVPDLFAIPASFNRPHCENRGTVDLPHKVSLDMSTYARLSSL
jgi:ribosomal protein L32